MPDLSEYVDRVLEEEDKVLLAEAASCFAAGAFRSAYITIWLAVGESLRRKFKEAAVRDHQAGSIVRQIEQLEAQHKAVDSFLIDKSKQYGFITDAEATRLRHLYENRNVFGHPYEQRPSEQVVRTAASEAIEIVLGRPVALREGYLSQQAQRICSDQTFLNDDQPTVAAYADLVRERSAAELGVWFLRKIFPLLDGVFADPSLDLLQRRGVWFVRAFLEADSTIFDRWDAADDLPDHQNVLAPTLAVQPIFTHLSAHAKDIVVNVLVQDAGAHRAFLRLLNDLADAEVLSQHHREAFEGVIDNITRHRLFRSDLPLRRYAGKVIGALGSHSWDPQNEAINAVRNAGPDEVAELTDQDQETLGRNVMQAAEGTARRAEYFQEDLGEGRATWPPAFIRGMMMEPIAHEDGILRFKTGQLSPSLASLRSAPEDARAAIVADILALIERSQPKADWHVGKDRDQAVETLRSMAEDPDLSGLSSIADALAAAQVDAED